MDSERTDRNQVRRLPNRGRYDRETIYGILDAGFLCHAGFVVNDQPFVIPTLYGRSGDNLYVHGSAASRMLRNPGSPTTSAVINPDGTLLAFQSYGEEGLLFADIDISKATGVLASRYRDISS